MGIFTRTLNILNGGTGRDPGIQSGAPSYYSSSSAVPVTSESAMQLSTVWACVKLITESVGSLPINVYKISDGGVRTEFNDHPLARLLRNKPNRYQTRQEYIESLVWQFCMQGNDYSQVTRDSKGQLVSLMPYMTPQMRVDLKDNGNVEYNYQTSGGVQKIIDPKDIWHNKLFGNGIIGLSPFAHARNSIAVAQAAEQATTNIYRNGGKPSGLLMFDKFLTKEQRTTAKQNFAEITSGNEDRLFVLEGGMDWKGVSLSPSDIELLSSRKFQIEEICRVFGVPSVLVNDTTATTSWGSGIEQIIQGFYKFTLRPYLERYESSMRANLLNNYERDTMEIEFDFQSLLQQDKSARIKSGKEAVQGGLMSPNQFRLSEGWKPEPGGDKLYMQQQMVPMDILDKIERGNTNETIKDEPEE